jgi:hypothetical protein
VILECSEYGQINLEFYNNFSNKAAETESKIMQEMILHKKIKIRMWDYNPTI